MMFFYTYYTRYHLFKANFSFNSLFKQVSPIVSIFQIILLEIGINQIPFTIHDVLEILPSFLCEIGRYIPIMNIIMINFIFIKRYFIGLQKSIDSIVDIISFTNLIKPNMMSQKKTCFKYPPPRNNDSQTKI